MKQAILFATGLSLLGAGLAFAQAPENSLPEGTFASSPEDCATLATKTPVELGEDFDFEVLTRKGLVAYQQACDFVNVFAHDAKSWVRPATLIPTCSRSSKKTTASSISPGSPT